MPLIAIANPCIAPHPLHFPSHLRPIRHHHHHHPFLPPNTLFCKLLSYALPSVHKPTIISADRSSWAPLFVKYLGCNDLIISLLRFQKSSLSAAPDDSRVNGLCPDKIDGSVVGAYEVFFVDGRNAQKGGVRTISTCSHQFSDRRMNGSGFPWPPEVTSQKNFVNKVNLIDVLGRDPEIKYFNAGRMCARSSLAVHESSNVDEPPSWQFDSLANLEEQERIIGCLEVGIFSYRRRGSWVCFGGGKRPRRPHVWKSKTRRGTLAKSAKLITLINSLSNVKEEVYGALDTWIAWELEFPLITVKKALRTLQNNRDWKRVIQVSKWMLSKGQGKTMGTYHLMLEAFAEEGRLEEAEALWKKVFEELLECTPRIMFTRMISIYERFGEYEKLLDVFADMEELRVKPDAKVVKIVAHTYGKIGEPDKQEKALKKYPFAFEGTLHKKEDVNNAEHHGEEVSEEDAIDGFFTNSTQEFADIHPAQGSEDIANSPVVASF